MQWLVDTTILARLANTRDVEHALVKRAVAELHRRGETLRTAAQNLIEFRNVATRPASANGLGLSVPAAEAKADEFESLFALVPDTPEIYTSWKLLAKASAAIGKQVHDVRLVAICQVHGLERLLTFNVRHFLRPAGLVAGFAVVAPHAPNGA